MNPTPCPGYWRHPASPLAVRGYFYLSLLSATATQTGHMRFFTSYISHIIIACQRRDTCLMQTSLTGGLACNCSFTCPDFYSNFTFFQLLNWWIWLIISRLFWTLCPLLSLSLPQVERKAARSNYKVKAEQPHCQTGVFFKVQRKPPHTHPAGLQSSSGIGSVSFFFFWTTSASHWYSLWMLFSFSIIDNPPSHNSPGFTAYILQENHEFPVVGNNCSQW